MTDCCNDKACGIEALRNRQSSTLKIALSINAVMFIVELTAGLIGGSVSLLADSLDMLGDALLYGLQYLCCCARRKYESHCSLV
jgi:Co/Zn/Cd efflux system component